MSARIVESSPASITIEITVPFGSSMLDFETQLQRQLHEVGNLATAEQLRRLDTDGSPIQVGPTTTRARRVGWATRRGWR
jgi:CheY-specific phosphatase CheX